MSEILSNPERLKQLRLQAQQLASIVRLPLRHKKWRGGSGEFAGAGSGSSLEFQDHRAYMAGDDPRHINWQAFARTGQYTMKVFREEVRPLVDLVCDVSASQFFDNSKAERVVELFHFCIASAQKSGTSLKVILVNGPEFSLLRDEILHSDKWPQRIPQFVPATSNADPPAIARLPLRPQALRILISDLLFPGTPETVLRPLSERNGRGLIFVPYCDAEANVTWEGNYEFIDPETRHHHLRRVESNLLKRYHQAYQRHFALWKSESHRYGISLARIASAPNLQRAFQAEAQGIGAVETEA